jgi:hypothetical protein
MGRELPDSAHLLGSPETLRKIAKVRGPLNSCPSEILSILFSFLGEQRAGTNREAANDTYVSMPFKKKKLI